MSKDGVEGIAELIVESKFGVVYTVEEMVTKGIDGSTANTARGSRGE